ncbi:MAG: YggS family pyridoxal phosphate-dependent enzyme [Clostridiales Family XIII bacterium]|jgi:pyridoxal phosphate enzyme (YggS family)|nr:YggS family pyridoxal phosphate-dependent enzyme [Clostridiales Family XIII bacterium]
MNGGTTEKSIAENVAAVRERIAAAANRAGRKADEVTLVAVSKTRMPGEIETAVEAGVLDLGENKVQEIRSKYDILRVFTENSAKNRNIKWHMIGHLQRNKVKYIVDKVSLIHSVDSLRLAEEIDCRIDSLGGTMDVLLQVNAAAEESKSGVAPGEVKQLVSAILGTCENVRIRGLMTIVPTANDPEDVRRYFSEIKSLYDEVGHEYRCEKLDFTWLSMGMTHDFEVAVEEGANMVRVGTGIFGSRVYV